MLPPSVEDAPPKTVSPKRPAGRAGSGASQAEAPRCPINVAARRSGLSAHVIRAWERRYGAITPDRGSTARRLYTDFEVQRLVLLRQAVELGHRIGEIARLPMDELRALVGQETLPGVEASPRIPLTQARLVDMAVEAALAMDSTAFCQTLLQATRTLSVPDLFEQFLGPFMSEVGESWFEGRMRVVHEHFASGHLRTFLGDLLATSNAAGNGPTILVTTPFGQHHELGALMSAITAARAGWTVLYLGPSLPAEEIAFAAQSRRVSAVALSVCFPHDDPQLAPQLHALRALLGADVPLLIGGTAASAYQDAIDAIGARCPVSLREYAALLRRLR